MTIQLEVTDDELFDPDIHLLSGDDANACLSRGHRTLSQEVHPGLYWIIVDTWTNETGDELTGPYRLEVTLEQPRNE